jgi:elongation factor Ts
MAADPGDRPGTAEGARPSIRAADVKALRDRTGAAMMDCKAALEEAGGDPEKAIEILRVKGQASAEKRSGRATGEGVVSSYIHAGGKVGVLVEVQCETDFVARTDAFQEFAREVALHIAGSPAPPRFVSADEIPAGEIDAERRVFEAKAREEGKPQNVVERIVDGQIAKWSKEVALLDQEHVRSDRYDGKTIEELRAEIAANTGENVRIARFARFAVGEG